MGVAAAILLFVFGYLFEFSQRKKLGLNPTNAKELKELLSRSKTDPQVRALRSLIFSGLCLFMFSVWEGSIRSVIGREWGAWSFALGLLSGLGLLYLRQKTFKTAPIQAPWLAREAALYILSLLFLAAPFVSLAFGAWFLIRLRIYQKKQQVMAQV